MDAWIDELVRNVTGDVNRTVPSGSLWIPDKKCKACIGCALPFTFVVRRHHCRLCGHLFCSECAKHFIPPVRSSPDQTWRRICKFCVQLPKAAQVVGAPKVHLVQHHIHYQSLESLKAAAENIQKQSHEPADVASSSRPTEASVPQAAASVVAAAPTAGPTGAAAAAEATVVDSPAMRPIITTSQSGVSSQASPVQSQQGSARAAPAKGEGALTWLLPDILDGPGLQAHGLDYSPPVVSLHRRLLDAVSDRHLSNITRQLLKGENVAHQDVWLPVIMRLAREAASLLSPMALSSSKDPDPRHYIKIKKLPEIGAPEGSIVVHGVVFKKNVALRRMRTHIEAPRIALLANSLEFARQAGSLIGFDAVLDKEKDVLAKSVEYIIEVEPDILVVQKNVARSVQEQLLARNITLVQNVKMDLLERLSRTTKAQIVYSVKDLTQKHLGVCTTFAVEALGPLNRCNSNVSVASVGSALAAAMSNASVPTTPPSTAGRPTELKVRDGAGGGQKTLMYFKGVPQRLGCTILLKGADVNELRRVKRIVTFMTYAAYHANLENAYLAEHMSVGLVAEAFQNGLCDMDNSLELLAHLIQLYVQASAARAANIPSRNGIVSTSPYVWRDKSEGEIIQALSAPTPFSRNLRSQDSALLRRTTSTVYAEIIQEEMDAIARTEHGEGEPSTSAPQLKLDTEVEAFESEPSTSTHAPAPSPCRSPLPVTAELLVAISNMPSEAASTSAAVHSPPSHPLPPTPGTPPAAVQQGLAATPSRVAEGSSKAPEVSVSRPGSPEFTDPLRRPQEGQPPEMPAELQEEDDVSQPPSEHQGAAHDDSSEPEMMLTESQDAGLLDIYRQQHIYVTMSSKNPKRNMYCEPHLITNIPFYGEQDISLYSFILGSCPASYKKCGREECGQGVTAHVKTMMYGNSRITMSFYIIPPDYPPLPCEDRIWFWVRPKDHGPQPLKTVRRVLLSKEASSVSLGRFLELCLCGHSLSVLDLQLNTQFVRYYGVGRSIMCMHQDYINISHINMPATVMRYTTAGQLKWMQAEKDDLLKEANDAFDWVLCILPRMAVLQDNAESLEFYKNACDQDRESFCFVVEEMYNTTERNVKYTEEQGHVEWINLLVDGLMELNRRRRQLALAQLTWAAFMKDPRFFERLTVNLKPSTNKASSSSSAIPQSSFKSHRPAYSMDNLTMLDGRPDIRTRSYHTMSMDADQLDAVTGHQRVDMSPLGVPIMTVAGVSVTSVLQLISVMEHQGCGLLDGVKSIVEQSGTEPAGPSNTPDTNEEGSSEQPGEERKAGESQTKPAPAAGSAGSDDGDNNDNQNEHDGQQLPAEEGVDHDEVNSCDDDDENTVGSAWVPHPSEGNAQDEQEDDNSALVPQSGYDDEGSASVGYSGIEPTYGDQPSLQSSPQETRYFSAAGTAALETTTVNEFGTPKSIRSGEEAEVTGPFRARLEAQSAQVEQQEQSEREDAAAGESSQEENEVHGERDDLSLVKSHKLDQQDQSEKEDASLGGLSQLEQQEESEREDDLPGEPSQLELGEQIEREDALPTESQQLADPETSQRQQPVGETVAGNAEGMDPQTDARDEQGPSVAGTNQAGAEGKEQETSTTGVDQAESSRQEEDTQPPSSTAADPETSAGTATTPGSHQNPFFELSTSKVPRDHAAPLPVPSGLPPSNLNHAATMAAPASDTGSWKIATNRPQTATDSGPSSDPLPITQVKRNLVTAATDPGLPTQALSDLVGLKPPRAMTGLRSNPRVGGPGQMEFEKTAKLPMPGRTLLPEGARGMTIPIFDGEPTSAVSYFLASEQYRRILQNRRSQVLQSLNRQDKEEWEQLMLIKDREPSTIKYNFNDESPGLPSEKASFQVIVHYPVRFGELREKCIMGGEEAFLASLCRCKRWQNRGGKSNAYFARTRDERFIIKGLSKTEKQSLLEFAPAYFAHLAQVIKGNQTSSLAKIFGVFTVSMKTQSLGGSTAASPFKDMDIIVMENIFYDHQIKRIYDLKGSERARFNQEAALRPDDSGVVHLDDNLRRNNQTQPILVDTTSHHQMETALWSDTDFLQGLGVMDYSLLVGVVGEDKPNKSNHQLVVALIDYIRTYTWDKQLETWVKSSGILGGGGKEPTIISPKQYMKRFRTAMQGYFTMVPNSSHFEPPLPPDASVSSTSQDLASAGDSNKQADR